MGHRAAEVVGADENDLDRLLRVGGTTWDGQRSQVGPEGTGTSPALLEVLLQAVRDFDTEQLTHLLLLDWARLGPVAYLNDAITPLVRAVGEEWAEGRLEIRHEHFLSERIADLLRTLRLPFEERADGPSMILATLPGETHALGLQMAALAMASAGRRVLYLGTEVPPEQVAALAVERGASAVALSVSVAGRGSRMTGQIQKLRRKLPRRIHLILGGEGARPLTGTLVMGSFSEVHDWARAVAPS